MIVRFNNFLLKGQHMQKKVMMVLCLTLAVLVTAVSTNHAYSQEVGLSTFQENAQIIIDKSISKNVTASISLQSTSIQEIQIPAQLEQGLRADKRVAAVIFTNEEQCVLGVVDESCVMINIISNPDNKGVLEIQNYTKTVSELYIDEINKALDTEAEFHSVFIHTNDESNRALDTSGDVSGRGTISAVYTLPLEDTSSMYEKISAILIPGVIRDKGGFYDLARELSHEKNSKMTFSILPTDTRTLLQLKVSVEHPNAASQITEISPLDFFNVESIQRSDYFEFGFYPLNSIIQVVVLSPEYTHVSDVHGNVVPTQIVDGEKIPTDVTKTGWVFDPQEGERIQGKYLFGKETSVDKRDLLFSLGGKDTPTNQMQIDESIVVVIIITIVAVAAALFYLKGYKK